MKQRSLDNTLSLGEGRYRSLPLAGVVALLCCSPATLQAGAWSVTSGLDYHAGDYGQPLATTGWYLPFAISYRTDPWVIKASLPYMWVEGPEWVTTTDSSGATVEQQQNRRQQGVGDLWLSVTRELPWGTQQGITLDLTAKLKLPLADETIGLGTGEVDGALQGDVTKRWGRWLGMGSMSYNWRGRSADYQPLDGWGGSLGGQYDWNRTVAVGLQGAYRQASYAGSEDAWELTGFLTRPITAQWSSSWYLVHGFTESSPDLEGGVSLSYRF
uniref:Uncharacterized protein n=1 Tax=Magnetococcus massalia (strain MO-1) TaxID=451514 RepID=A0A1S7LE41_MAGMO|nr:Conserved exported protein of unknown function [Candidatus Magnetococcus massalia]